MERPRRTGLDRISTEEQEEAQMTELLTGAMMAQAGPAAFLTGKTIEASVITPAESKFRFTDGSGLTFIGGALQYNAEMTELTGPERTDISS